MTMTAFTPQQGLTLSLEQQTLLREAQLTWQECCFVGVADFGPFTCYQKALAARVATYLH